MEFLRYHDPAAFYARTEPFLVGDEACNNLLLGIGAGLARHPERFEHPPYMATVEEHGEVVAVALRTPPHGLILSRVAARDTLPLLAERVREEYTTLPGVLAPAEIVEDFARAWRWVSGQPYRKGLAERIYRLEQVRPVSGVPGELRCATPADRGFLREWYVAFHAEAVGPVEFGDLERIERSLDDRLSAEPGGLCVWYDGRSVSMAGASGPTPSGIRIGPVYTPPEFRGRGYASACVAGLSDLMLRSGRRACFLFTDLSNPTSNKIYRAIGYEPVCDVDAYEFLEAVGTTTGTRTSSPGCSWRKLGPCRR